MSKKRRKQPEVITISDGTDVSADSDLPGWLPDGWDRVSRWNNNRDVSFYFPCPTCVGITLQTQDEVLRHCLFSCEDAPLKSQALFRNVQELATPRQLRHANESPPPKDGQKSGSFEEPEYLARRFGPARRTSGHTSKKPIDEADDDDTVDIEEDGENLTRSTDGVQQTREDIVESGNEHECHKEVGTEAEVVGYKESISTVEQDQRKQGNST